MVHTLGSVNPNCGLFHLFGLTATPLKHSPKALYLSIHEDQSQSIKIWSKSLKLLAWDRIPRYVHHVNSVFFLLHSYSSKVAFQGVSYARIKWMQGCHVFFYIQTICSIDNLCNNNNSPNNLPTHKFLIWIYVDWNQVKFYQNTKI